MRTWMTFLTLTILSGAAWAQTDGLAGAASALISSLTPPQREQAVYPLKDDARATWSNLPTVMGPPCGDNAERAVRRTALAGARSAARNAVQRRLCQGIEHHVAGRCSVRADQAADGNQRRRAQQSIGGDDAAQPQLRATTRLRCSAIRRMSSGAGRSRGIIWR